MVVTLCVYKCITSYLFTLINLFSSYFIINLYVYKCNHPNYVHMNKYTLFIEMRTAAKLTHAIESFCKPLSVSPIYRLNALVSVIFVCRDTEDSK